MVNKKFCLGMLTIVLVFGLAVVGCDFDSSTNDKKSGRTFLLKNIPDEYNGKYAFYGHINNYGYFFFGGNYDSSTNTPTGVLISNGSVSLPMWHGNNGIVEMYYPEDTNWIGGNNVMINDIATSTSNAKSGTVCIQFTSVKFSNGVVTMSWNDKSWIYIYP